MKRLFSSKLAGLALIALVIGQMLTVAVIPSMVFQPMNIHVSNQGLSVGLFVSVYSVITLIGGLFAGKSIDRFGPERNLLVLIPLLTGVYLLYQIAHSFGELLTVRVLNGILFAFIVNGFVVLVRKKVLYSSDKVQARIHGIINSLNTVGSGIAMYVGMIFVNRITWLWLSTAIIGWIVVILVYWAIYVTSFTQMTIMQLMNKAFTSVYTFTRSLFVKEAFSAALPDVGMSSVYWAFLSYFALYKQQEADVILLVCTMAYGFSAMSIIPILVTKHKKMVVGWSISVCILALILISIAGSFWLLLTAGVLIGIALAGNNLGILERVNHSVDKKLLGGANATASFLRQLGAIIGPSYAGLMWSVLGKENMWLALIPLLLVSLMFLFMKQESQEKTSVEFAIAIKRMRAFFAAASIKSEIGTLAEVARTIQKLQTGEEEVDHLEEANQRWLGLRVKHHCHALIAMKSADGFAGLSLEQEIREVEEMLYGLLKKIEVCHLQKYYNALHTTWGYFGPEEGAYWVSGDSAEKIMASLKTMIEDKVKPVKNPEEVQRFLSAVQTLDLIDLRFAFEKCGVEDNWNKALHMATT
jgi:MFS family permease